jgi:hypothetical protein
VMWNGKGIQESTERAPSGQCQNNLQKSHKQPKE